MVSNSRGRKSGSRNRGFFYRKSHSVWCANVGGRFTPLTDENGDRLRAADCSLAAVKAAYKRFLKTQPAQPKRSNGVTLEEVCNYYLKVAKQESPASTVEQRADTLFDLCYGLPPRWRPILERDATAIDRISKTDKIHKGYGALTISELRPFHLEEWLDAHQWTDRRTRLIEEIRMRVKRFPEGPLFHNSINGPWKRDALTRAFLRAKEQAEETGIVFDDDVCLYSCRHTYAMRMLTNYWSKNPINMEQLAALMGNTPKVCAKHYADLAKEAAGVDELIWTAC